MVRGSWLASLHHRTEARQEPAVSSVFVSCCRTESEISHVELMSMWLFAGAYLFP